MTTQRILSCVGGYVETDGETATVVDVWQNKQHTMPHGEATANLTAYMNKWPRCEYINALRALFPH